MALEVNDPEVAAPDRAARDGDHDQVLRWRRALLAEPSEPSALAALVEHARAHRDWVRLALLQARRFATDVGAAAFCL